MDVAVPKRQLEPFRLALRSTLEPQDGLRCLRGDARPFALSGDWFGGVTLLGSEPVNVADPDGDPFSLLDSQPELSPGQVSVGGGWVGWFGFGLGAHIERLPPPPPAPMPRPRFSLAFYDHVVLHDGGRWWFEGLWCPERAAALSQRYRLWQARLGEAPAAPTRHQRLTPFRIAGAGAPGHLKAVADCRRRIAAGELFQANLCLRLEAAFAGNPIDLFASALTARPRFGAVLDGVVSLSPERFLRRSKEQVQTEPIKGTRPRSGGERERRAALDELLVSPKDAAEHAMIVDLMRNDLGRVCAYGSIGVEQPRAEPHDGVWHLVSTVHGRLRQEVSDGELLRATFPPGSVTGAPKVQALKVISALEGTAREVFTGAIGMASPVAGLDLNVAIRTFELCDGAIWIGVGGGIVADSDPRLELEEALAKAAGPIAAIGGRLEKPPYRRVRLSPGARDALKFGTRPNPAHGVLETVLVEQGVAVRLDEHLRRLALSMRDLYGALLPPGIAASAKCAAARSHSRSRLRIISDQDGLVSIKVSLAPARGNRPTLLMPFILPGGLGAHKWDDRRLVDALVGAAGGAIPLLLDGDGLVLEAGYANVWVTEGDDVITPPADGRILPGVTRAKVLAIDRHSREEPIDLNRLLRGDGIFLTSSLSGCHSAAIASANRSWGSARTLRDLGQGTANGPPAG